MPIFNSFWQAGFEGADFVTRQGHALSMDDITGIGVADDFLIGPVSAGISQGILMIFG